MRYYLLRRFLYMVVLLVAVSAFSFFLIDLPPGDYSTGTLHLRAHVRFHVETGATVWSSKDPAAFDKRALTAQGQPQLANAHAQHHAGHVNLGHRQHRVLAAEDGQQPGLVPDDGGEVPQVVRGGERRGGCHRDEATQACPDLVPCARIDLVPSIRASGTAQSRRL